mgnify:CR=1 FL=1
MTIPLDTNLFIAYTFARDMNHQRARQFLDNLPNERCLVAAPVLPELFYLCARVSDYATAVRVFSTVRANFEIVPLLGVDMQRMEHIMTHYADSRFDFTDTAIMALAERLSVARIATFDRRDFAQYRPMHAAHLTLLP